MIKKAGCVRVSVMNCVVIFARCKEITTEVTKIINLKIKSARQKEGISMKENLLFTGPQLSASKFLLTQPFHSEALRSIARYFSSHVTGLCKGLCCVWEHQRHIYRHSS